MSCDLRRRMPGISFVNGIISDFMTGPRFRTAMVSGALRGETAYTAMPEGSRRDSAAAHQATMSFASAYARLGLRTSRSAHSQ